MPDPVIGHRLFADGVTRPIYLEAAGRQDIVGADGGARDLCRAARLRRPEDAKALSA
jgi:hypothetical protein